MIGVYDYTVILTYLSLLSAAFGIILTQQGAVMPAALCLMLSGLLDGFDGKVARTKKNRTAEEKEFGIQIDSLTDIVAFGVLPAAIGGALLKQSALVAGLSAAVRILLYLSLALFVLAALVRLAWYNTEETVRQKVETGRRKHYVGLPVTTACLIFPLVLLLERVLHREMAVIYCVVALLTAFAFVCNIKVKKPGMKGIFIMIGLGIAELIVYLCLHGN